jgi:hypothetical protein
MERDKMTLATGVRRAFVPTLASRGYDAVAMVLATARRMPRLETEAVIYPPDLRNADVIFRYEHARPDNGRCQNKDNLPL